MPDPIILGFDTSSHACAVAVVQGGTVRAHTYEDMQKGQAERLMPLIARTLDDAGVQYGDLAALGVGIGPGNFTGIRIAVSAARGLALGLNRRAVGVSGFEALRFGVETPCACTIATRGDQVFFQDFQQDGSSNAPRISNSDSLPEHDGPLIGVGGRQPCYPAAVAIALISAQRYQTELERPAPLYLRPADAAPARDTGPRILS